MSLKTIMVHVDSKAGQTIDAALALGSEFQAHVVGFHPRNLGILPLSFESGPEFYGLVQQWSDDEAKAARTLFEERAQRSEARTEWRDAEGIPAQIAAMQGRYGDLLVVGQTDPVNGAYGTPRTLAEDLVFALGRPLLVVPYIGASMPCKRALVAWNASREATRAVNDAIPLLQRAEKVSVLAVNPEGGSEGHGDVPCADICLHLARHGVRAEAQYTRAKDVDVGDILLSEAADLDADLIVMGAYGHSRLREMILGGATRTVLRHMTVPVLLSH